MTPETENIEPLMEEATALLKSLSHPARLMICCQLREGEMAVGDMETELEIRQPRLSRELAKLREEGLVETRRASKVIFYRLAEGSRVRAMVDAICAVMLDKTDVLAARPVMGSRKNRAGGYGVFARTSRDQVT